jgi:two-component system NtrC family sensor kinase
MPGGLLPRYLSFQAKVLVPVLIVMASLVAGTLMMVNSRISKEFRTEAGQKLKAAEAVFKKSQKMRLKNLLARYGNVPNDSRVIAVAQKADPETTRVMLRDLLHELGGEIGFFTSEQGQRLATETGDPRLNTSLFQSNSSISVSRAMEGQANVNTILIGDRLFDVVSLPIFVNRAIVGVFTFGAEMEESVAEDFKQLTHTEVVFQTSDRIAVSTLSKPDLHSQLTAVLSSAAPGSGSYAPIRELILDNEHFLGLVGPLPGLSDQARLNYVLLSSYEQPLSALHATQHTLGLFSTLAIVISAAIVWALIRKITEPLRVLRDSAEAVGRGDFTQRVQVTSADECGELAGVFNRMTENLKSSREELEQTVKTLRTTQAQLVQSEKLSAVGEFVAGVTHELNNPLTSVIGFAELLQQSDVNERHRRFLELIVTSAQRCHKIVQGLLSFARQHKPERKAVKVHELVEATIGILQYQMRTNNIQVNTNFDPHLPKVMADPHQLQQVFLNIINNARQAIEAFRPRGEITVTTETCQNGIRLIFEDDGPGIAAENLNKIFNPFFTTKEVGKGTGLGLSLTYGIIKEHGGSIRVESKPGEGATFIIELPLPKEKDNTGTSFITRPVATTFDGRGKKVLVIDDEDAILNLIRETLAETGCVLDLAPDGEAALQRMRQGQYDLMICDWKMPGLNGQELYNEVRATDSAAASRFIFMSGDVMNEKMQKFLETTGNACIAKPFSLDEFRAAAGKILKAA